MKKQRFSPRIAANGLVLKTETQHHRQHSNNSRKGVVALATETEMKTRDSGDGRSSETNCSKIVCGLPPDGGGMACMYMDMEGREGMGWGGERRGRGPRLLRTAAEGATVPFQGCKGTVGRLMTI